MTSRATLALAALAGLAACGKPAPVLVIGLHDAATGEALAGRVQLFDAAGAPVHFGTLDLYGKRQAATACELGPFALAGWDGIVVGRGAARVPVGKELCPRGKRPPKVASVLAPGRYHVVAWHGIEYERFEGDVEVGQGEAALDIRLHRAFAAPGALAADLHVHAEHSNDSGVPDRWRVLTQVAAGIQVIGLANHGVNQSAAATIAQLGLRDVVAALPSTELTSDAIHLGMYPTVVLPWTQSHGATPGEQSAPMSAAQLMELATRELGHPIIQVNHPRFRWAALFDAAGWDGVAWPPPFALTFQAFEVLNGHTAFNVEGDRRMDESARDLYTFTDHGFLVAPMGNSDTHHLNGVHDGIARTYVFTGDLDVAHYDQARFVDAIRHRRTEATTGPYLEVRAHASSADGGAGPGAALTTKGPVLVQIVVHQAAFAKATTLTIHLGTPAGPTAWKTLPLQPVTTQSFTESIPLAGADTWIGVDVSGDAPLPIEQTGTYQLEKGRIGITPFAIISPILVDADGDGVWTRGDAAIPLRDLAP